MILKNFINLFIVLLENLCLYSCFMAEMFFFLVLSNPPTGISIDFNIVWGAKGATNVL